MARTLQALQTSLESGSSVADVLLARGDLTLQELKALESARDGEGKVSFLESPTISDNPELWESKLGSTPTLMRAAPRAHPVAVAVPQATSEAVLRDPAITVRLSESPGSESRGSESPGSEPLSSQPPAPMDARYVCGREIGRGGMGRVLLARDRSIGRDVAVKVLLHNHEGDETQIRRFWMEVQANGILEHPSIVPIHDVGSFDTGELFYVMKLLEGRTLAQIIAGLRAGDEVLTRELSGIRLLTAFQQLAYAVAFAHDRGVLHRDVKPANIMIGDFGEVTLLDWGLAKPLDADTTDSNGFIRAAEDTASGMIVGTPQYMSPEAASGERLSDRSDVYSLGEVLYEILTLQPTYLDEGVINTLMRVRSGEVTPPRQRAPDRKISVELDEVCMAALAKQPTLRPSAKQLADAVGEILEGSRARERRRAEASRRVELGRAAVDRLHDLRTELLRVESKARKLEKTMSPHAELDEKRRLWELQDENSELRVEAVAAFAEAEASFQGALADVENDADARAGLAALYSERFLEAEKAHDREGQRYFASLVERYDDGRLAPLLAGRGLLEVTTSPPGALIRLERFAERDRRLIPSEPLTLGRSPLAPMEVPMGSYRVLAESHGRPVAIHPIQIARLAKARAHIVIRTAKEIGQGFVLVPGGPTVLGGDTIAYGGLERTVKIVPEFAIARYPVTCAEYLEFVNDLAQANADESRRRVPRAAPEEGHYWTFDPEAVLWELPEKATWSLDYPVFGISFDDASAYCEWRSAQTGEKLRLPFEDEWEKAARGADERFFPWGDHFDATFCKMKDSRGQAHSEPEPVGSYPTDCSPYGIFDMAGGVRELCVTVLEGELVPVMRGGCWHDTGLFCRSAFRHVTKPHFVNTGLGFRVAKSL